jgi:hypothetical protein
MPGGQPQQHPRSGALRGEPLALLPAEIAAAIDRRASPETSRLTAGSASMRTPRNGGTASKMTSEHRGSAAMCRSFTSFSAMTTSKQPSWNRNQTGELTAVPSLRYVVRTAGDGASSRLEKYWIRSIATRTA